ncbi:NADH-plastoquinone oxidoreductase subunit 7 [Tanacetum coccineum]|uniref:NADH-plastoquinone oxidoreductase subunit 7 n=1 Tax=Tanacetum coccineum TaxID=301880 RepID=A0ABQ5DTE9_9ASTR
MPPGRVGAPMGGAEAGCRCGVVLNRGSGSAKRGWNWGAGAGRAGAGFAVSHASTGMAWCGTRGPATDHGGEDGIAEAARGVTACAWGGSSVVVVVNVGFLVWAGSSLPPPSSSSAFARRGSRSWWRGERIRCGESWCDIWGGIRRHVLFSWGVGRALAAVRVLWPAWLREVLGTPGCGAGILLRLVAFPLLCLACRARGALSSAPARRRPLGIPGVDWGGAPTCRFRAYWPIIQIDLFRLRKHRVLTPSKVILNCFSPFLSVFPLPYLFFPLPLPVLKASGRGDAEHSLPHLSCLPTMLIKMEDLISNLSLETSLVEMGIHSNDREGVPMAKAGRLCILKKEMAPLLQVVTSYSSPELMELTLMNFFSLSAIHGRMNQEKPMTVPATRKYLMIVNMGPHYPSMHGVLRLIVTLDGEDVIDCEPILGYLHRDKVVEEEWICFFGGNSSSGTKKYRGSNSSDGGNIEDGVNIPGGVIGSSDEIGEITDGIILEFSEELKEMLPDEAGK